MKTTTLSKDTLLELMAYADGELEGGDRERIEKLVAESDEAKAFVQNLEALGGHIRLAGDPEPTITLDGIADTVLARIEREERKAPTQKRIVVALDEIRAGQDKRKAARATPAGAPWKPVAGVVVAALALAASVAMLMREDKPGASNQPQAPKPEQQQSAPRPTQPDGVKEVLAAMTQGVDVETVDAPQAVSVFYVPAMNAAAGANVSSVVVWIEDEVKP